MPVEYIPHPIQVNIRNETAARAYGVVYTNTSNRPIMVIINNLHITTAAAQFCLAQLNINGVGVDWSGWFVSIAAGQLYGTCIAMVDSGGTYGITTNITAPAAITLNRWTEIDL